MGRAKGRTTLTVWPSTGGRRSYLVLVAGPAEAPASVEVRRLRAGEATQISIPSAAKVDVQHSEVASIETVANGKLVVRAHIPGTATLQIVSGPELRTYRLEVDREAPLVVDTPLCDEAGLPAPAQEAFRSALKLARERKHRASLPLLEEALRLEPRAAIAHLRLGMGHANIGDSRRGAEEYRAFLAACPAHELAENIRKMLATFEAHSAGRR